LGLSAESGTFQKVITLGIDIAADRATCALLARSGKTIEFRKSWTVEFTGDAEAFDQLRQSLAQECPAPPDAIATTIPSAQVSHRILHLPFKETSKLQATIPFELESEVPLDIETSVVAWRVLGEAPHSATVLAAVSRNEDIAAHLEFLAKAGIDPALVTLGTLATADLLTETNRNTLLIDLREDGGLAFSEKGQLRKLHGIGSAEPQAILEEVRWAAAAYANEAPSQIVLTGEEQLTAGLVLPDALPRESLSDGGPAWLSSVPPEATRAAALARMATEAPHRWLNFRSGAFAYHAPSEEAHRQLRRTGWIAAAAALILLGTWLLMFAERRAELDELRARIATQTKTIAPKAPRGTEVRRVRAALEQLEKRSALLGGGTVGAPTLDRLLAIHAAIPAQIPLEVADLTLDPSGVRFRGRTDTFESVDIVSSALASLPEFATANVQDVKAGVDGRIEFRATLETEGGS
jgi:type II secretion system protein L